MKSDSKEDNMNSNEKIVERLKAVKMSDISPEEIARGKAYMESILAKQGRIKISDISPEVMKAGKSVIESLEYSDFAFSGTPMRFDEIDNSLELARYLASRQKISSLSEKYVSHYTNYDVAIKIILSGMFHLNNPKNMNDGLEFSSDTMDASKLYFASFSLENSENIAMWSMYGQPWEKGVKISIPKRLFMDWLKQIKVIYKVDLNTYEPIMSNPINDEMFVASISRVAYVEWNKNGDVRTVSCGESAKNEKLKNVDTQILTGLIKDSAWSYEKEVRLRVDLKNEMDATRVAVSLPREILESIVITTGPRFAKQSINKRSVRPVSIEKSLFDGKLNYIYCDRCDKRK